MERSTIIAAGASGMLVLVAGVGAVAAVASLQAAGQESLAIGQAQPQAVAGAVQSSTTLTKPEVNGPDPASDSDSGADGTTPTSSGSGPNNSSNNTRTSAESSHDDDDHASDDSSDDHDENHESEDDDDD